jgi:hypothetical protein
MDVLSFFMLPDFVQNVTVIGRSSDCILYQFFLPLKSVFGYEDYMERWWSRTERKNRYTLLLYSHHMQTREI